MRYQIIYSKRGEPLVTWTDSRTKARSLANRYRQVGYNVQVWAHTKDGASMTDL